MPDKTMKTEPADRLIITLKRSLHILALIQHSADENWNARTLADALSTIPGENALEPKSVMLCVKHLQSMGFPVITEKGARRITLSRELSEQEMLGILTFYRIIAIEEDAGINDCFKTYVSQAKNRSLWIIGRVYFAALENRKTTLSYYSEHSGTVSEYMVKPQKWIYRDNAVYLAADTERHGLSLFRLTRIRDISVLDEHFYSTTDKPCDILKDSLGAFIGSRVHRISLEYPPSLHNRVIEEFGRVDLVFDSGNPLIFRVSFNASDLLTVCKTVFPFGGDVVIVAPEEARIEMRRLLDGNIKGLK